MTVLDNLLTGRHARIRTNPFAEMLFLPSVRREEGATREAVEHIIELVELERYRHAPVAGLPFGIQKNRRFCARARARAGAAHAGRAVGRAQSGRARGSGPIHPAHEASSSASPMIWIEHDMQMVADLADRIHVLDYGRTLAEGPPRRC